MGAVPPKKQKALLPQKHDKIGEVATGRKAQAQIVLASVKKLNRAGVVVETFREKNRCVERTAGGGGKDHRGGLENAMESVHERRQLVYINSQKKKISFNDMGEKGRKKLGGQVASSPKESPSPSALRCAKGVSATRNVSRNKKQR